MAKLNKYFFYISRYVRVEIQALNLEDANQKFIQSFGSIVHGYATQPYFDHLDDGSFDIYSQSNFQ